MHKILLIVLVNVIVLSENVSLALQLPSNESEHVENSKRTSIMAIKAKGDKVATDPSGSLTTPLEISIDLYLIGDNVADINVTFTKKPANKTDDCDSFDHTEVYTAKNWDEGVSVFTVTFPKYDGFYYLCIQTNETGRKWLHQGDTPWMKIAATTPLLPLWAQICLIIVLLSLSGLFSGLNLGLMSLDKNELKVIARCGTESEKRFSKTITPVRKRGNYLLCTLLLGNVLVNSSMTILLDDITSGLVAVIVSTLSIVIFGEIIPQAACSRHGLAVGARTIPLTYLFMFITFPLSYPISKILDKLLGDEIGNVYDRERLMEYIRVTKTYNKLEDDEVNIISGALGLKTKTVGEVMTRLEDVFMLSITACLDFNTVSDITRKGYSRIPVYDEDRKNIVALLHAKDLAFIDPDDKTPIRTVIDFYKHQLIHTFEDETLNNVLNSFKQGKSHMAFVKKIYDTGDEDPYYDITGIVTLEDVIEEILQIEIVDETDILVDNRKKQRRKEAQSRQDFSDFARIGKHHGTHSISSQLALATFQYLSTALDAFKKPLISETVLRRLLAQEIYYYIKVEENVPESDRFLYIANKPAEYFIMILEGRVEVVAGNESLVFESGPFSYFGTTVLKLTPEQIIAPTPRTSVTTRPPTPDSPRANSIAETTFITSRAPSITPANQILTPSATSDLSNSRPASATTSPSGTGNKEIVFVPDFTVKVVDHAIYMKLPRNVYLAARRATMMESKKEWSHDTEKFKREVDTVFTHSLNNPNSNAQNSERDMFCEVYPTPTRKISVNNISIGKERISSSKSAQSVAISVPNRGISPVKKRRTSSSNCLLKKSNNKDEDNDSDANEGDHLISMP